MVPPSEHVKLLGDAERLRRVIANLLENALRYTDAPGRVRVSAEAAGRGWTLVIEDSAPAVPPEALPRLAERFFRVDQSRSREGGGSGLGLAICLRIAEAHDGALHFEASPLGGLRVELRLHQGGKA